MNKLMFFSTLATLTSTASAVLTLTASDTGWFAERGFHHSNNRNGFTGKTTSSLFGTAPNATDRYNSFLLFDIASVTGEISSLGLNLFVRDILGMEPEGSFCFSIYDVSTASSGFDSDYSSGSTMGLDIFNDLQSGQKYGDFKISASSLNGYVPMELSDSAVATANNLRGQTFAIGITFASSFRTIEGPEGANFGVMAYTQNLRSELVIGGPDTVPPLTAVPEPATAILTLALGLVGFVLLRHYFRRANGG